MVEIVKRNWKSIVIYGSFLTVIIICMIMMVTKCVKDNTPNGTTVIDSETFIDMVDDNRDFIIVFGQYNCSACQLFNDTLRDYTSDGKTVYYLYTDNDNDLMINEALKMINDKLKEIPKSRNINILKTPTTVFVEDGIFKDGYQGHVDVTDREEYEEFKKIVNGHYVKRKIVLNSSEMLDKINSGDEFVFTIGQYGCSACAAFETTINRYLQDGNDIYYVYANDTSDPNRGDFINYAFSKIANEIQADREIGHFTPTTIYVKNGEFKDAYQGVLDTYDTYDYEKFVDMMKGEYENEAYPFS